MASDEPQEVLRALWRAEGQELDVTDDSAPQTQRACRNMKDVTFDGMAPPGTDLSEAWRARLRSEGKLGTGSLRDLVLGDDR